MRRVFLWLADGSRQIGHDCNARPVEKLLVQGSFLGPETFADIEVASAHVVYERSFPVAGPVGSEGNAAAFSSDSTGRCSSGR